LRVAIPTFGFSSAGPAVHMAGLAGNAADSQATGRQRGNGGSEGGGPDERRRGQVFPAKKAGWTGRQQGQDESDESDKNADSFQGAGRHGRTGRLPVRVVQLQDRLQVGGLQVEFARHSRQCCELHLCFSTPTHPKQGVDGRVVRDHAPNGEGFSYMGTVGGEQPTEKGGFFNNDFFLLKVPQASHHLHRSGA
jgi:hypothetical protein